MSVSQSRPLVLVVRSTDALDAWTRILSKCGATILPVGLIKTVPIAQSRRMSLWKTYTVSAVAFTSANAVRYFVKNLGRSKARAVAPLIAVVGAATAAAARGAGLRPTIMPKPNKANAKELARLILRALRKQPHPCVLFPCAKQALPTLPTVLRDAGVRVIKFPVYKTAPNKPGIAALKRILQKQTPSAAFFASPSAVKVAVTVLNKHDLRKFKTMIECIAIGPTTHTALRSAGFKRTRCADPSPQNLRKTLKAALA